MLVPTAAGAKERPFLKITDSRLHVTAGGNAKVDGSLPRTSGVRSVVLQVRRGAGWKTLARDRVDRRGRYRLAARVRQTGSTPVRILAEGSGTHARRTRALGRLNVYRTAYASWYGPGLYGNRTACGGTLSPGTVGVAHKTLPCGTMVTFRRNGRSVRAAVIDRGPYVGGREYDLTAALAQQLGFGGHGPVLATR